MRPVALHSVDASHQSRSPNHSRLGLFFVRSRQKQRVVAGSCGRRRTSPVGTVARSRAGFALSWPFFSPASLSAVGAKSARAANDTDINQQLTRGLIERVLLRHWGGEGQTEPIGRRNRLTEPCVRRCAAACVLTPHHRQGSECHVQHREQQGPPAPIGPGSACHRDERRSWAACAEGPERSPKHAGAHGSGGGEGQLGAARLTTA